jgi:hypothetical protein
LKNIFEFLNKKYSEDKLNYFHILKSIIYFDDAEDELLHKTYIEYDWERIKGFYLEQYSKIEL